MHKNLASHTRYFFGVAIAGILFGAGVFAVGLAEWAANLSGGFSFFFPAGKMLGGAMVVLLSYIVLELELIRTAKG